MSRCIPGGPLEVLLERLAWRQAPDPLLGAPPAPRAEPTDTSAAFAALPPARGERGLGSGRTLLVHHPSPRPPGTAGLWVMSFNILLGGRRRESLDAYFARLEAEGRLPDVLGLQEANQEVAAALAERHGYHLAYCGASGDGERRLLNGKAVLSRHPLRAAVHHTYAIPERAREAAIRRNGRPGELVEDRGALCATLDVGGRPVRLLCVHHTLCDAGMNASQLLQLTQLVRAEMSPAVALGDFNANTLVQRNGTRLAARLRRASPPRTVEDYRTHYDAVWSSVGDRGVGNVEDVRVRCALARLRRLLPEALERAPYVHVRLPDGTRVTPREARRALARGEVARESEAGLRLQDAADTATLLSEPNAAGVVPATGKRFDTLFASPGLHPLWAEVDRSTSASDHVPVIACFRLA